MKAKKKAKSKVSKVTKKPAKHARKKRSTTSHSFFAFKNFGPFSDALRKFGWVMPAIVACVGLALLLKPGKNSKMPLLVTSAELQSLFHKADAKNTVGDKVAFWAEQLLKKPGLLAPLGTGPKVNDVAPLIPEKFDCTTYVETVGALSKSGTPVDFFDRLVSIRYKDGDVAYETRNHFPEIDWIPNNLSAGNIEDITKDVASKAGIQAQTVTKKIYKMKWFHAQKNRFANRIVAQADSTNAAVPAEVNYISLDQMKEAIKHVPQGAVLNIVRNNRPQQPVLITHQGFLIWKSGKPFFRHVTREREVVEVPFWDYVSKMKHMPWTVLGFNINTYRG